MPLLDWLESQGLLNVMSFLRLAHTCNLRHALGQAPSASSFLGQMVKPNRIFTFAKNASRQTSKQPPRSASTFVKAFSLGLVGVTPVLIKAEGEEPDKANGRLLLQKHQVTKLDQHEASFDWIKFLSILQEHLLYLLAALATATAVAVINIKVLK